MAKIFIVFVIVVALAEAILQIGQGKLDFGIIGSFVVFMLMLGLWIKTKSR